jgi:hypothetical protein
MLEAAGLLNRWFEFNTARATAPPKAAQRMAEFHP